MGVRCPRAECIAELRDYLRRTLAKGFGHQVQGADLEEDARGDDAVALCESARPDIILMDGGALSFGLAV